MIKNYKYITIDSCDSKHVFCLLNNLYSNLDISSTTGKVVIKNYPKDLKNSISSLPFLFQGSEIRKIFLSVCLLDLNDIVFEKQTYIFDGERLIRRFSRSRSRFENLDKEAIEIFGLESKKNLYEQQD